MSKRMTKTITNRMMYDMYIRACVITSPRLSAYFKRVLISDYTKSKMTSGREKMGR